MMEKRPSLISILLTLRILSAREWAGLNKTTGERMRKREQTHTHTQIKGSIGWLVFVPIHAHAINRTGGIEHACSHMISMCFGFCRLYSIPYRTNVCYAFQLIAWGRQTIVLNKIEKIQQANGLNCVWTISDFMHGKKRFSLFLARFPIDSFEVVKFSAEEIVWTSETESGDASTTTTTTTIMYLYRW